jgi:uncharacterized protein (TIGR03382 family)
MARHVPGSAAMSRASAWALVAALLALPALAWASPAPGGPRAITGGRSAPAGKWPDVAAVMVRGAHECTGTLIAPTVVITAGHCVNAGLDVVIVGTSSLARQSEGEQIRVVRQIEYPDSWNNYDVALLVLEEPSSRPVRALANGWARADIVDGAGVSVVGFGATDRDASVFVDDLQEAETTITDADCSTEGVGCNAAAQPAGELGAGGDGVDTCTGDSGGPLYLATDYGVFLAGITSRAYSGSEFPCSGGGIYTRADAIVEWIEDESGVQVTDGPMPALRLVARDGLSAVGAVTANDPFGVRPHQYVLTTPPAHGPAVVRDEGMIVYTPDDGFEGEDPFTVTVTDTSRPDRVVTFTVDARAEGSGGFCSAAGGGAGALVPALAALLALRRRRR